MDPRVARSRAAIVAAAFDHFLRDGYVRTSMDDLAATAQVSKRTIYNIFGGKEQLFRAILGGAISTAERFAREAVPPLADATDAETAAAELRELAVELAQTVLGSGQIIALRRLVIAERASFPEIAAEYYRRAPGLTLRVLANAFEQLAQRGLLDVRDARAAAEHFAFLIMGAQLDMAMFRDVTDLPGSDEITSSALVGADAFLRAYGRSPDPG